MEAHHLPCFLYEYVKKMQPPAFHIWRTSLIWGVPLDWGPLLSSYMKSTTIITEKMIPYMTQNEHLQI